MIVSSGVSQLVGHVHVVKMGDRVEEVVQLPVANPLLPLQQIAENSAAELRVEALVAGVACNQGSTNKVNSPSVIFIVRYEKNP